MIPKNVLILIALGPSATVLAYDLSKIGYQAIDIGHADIEYEWFIRRAISKIAIEYKDVNEAKNGLYDKSCISRDEVYKKEIIKEIYGA